jgi:hypothetical protein
MTALTKVEPIQNIPVTHSKNAPCGKELDQVVETCKLLAQSPYYNKMGPGGVLAIWLTAREMGLPPMMCLNGGLYTFSGQVSLSGKVINTLIIQAGHRADVIHLDDKSCKIRFIRCDRKKGQGDMFEYEYTMDMAKAAGLTSKKNWQTNPRDMLYNRCISGGSIKFMPDVTCGAYAIGELPGDGNIIDDSAIDIKPIQENSQSDESYNVKPLYMDTISHEQAAELSQILIECSEENQKGFMEYIKKSFEADSLDKLPTKEFERMKKIIIKKRDEHQKMLAEKEMTINVKAEEV